MSRRERDRRATEAAKATDPQASDRSARDGRRSRRVSPTQTSFLDRFGGLLLLGFAIVGGVILVAVFVQSSTRTAYACDSLLTPGPVAPEPTATPALDPPPSPGASIAPAPTQQLGFPVTDLGTEHERDTSVVIDYAYCPPASGPHWSIGGEAPAPRDFYGPEESVEPQQWLHNLEHGFVMALYSCGPDGQSCPSEAELAALRVVYEDAPTTDGALACGVPNKVIVTRFDEMSSRFAYVSWDRELLTDTVDPQVGITFAEQWTDPPSAPERGGCFR